MPFQTHNPRSSDEWTEARVILLLKLDAENILSRSQIANRLAEETGSIFSRNAVIGKLSRLGAPPKERQVVLRIQKRTRPPAMNAKPPMPRREPAVLQESLGLSLHDLTDKTCRYPTHAENAPAAFCGHPIHTREAINHFGEVSEIPTSYCAAHYQLCYYEPRGPRPDASHRMRIINAKRHRQELWDEIKPTCEAA